MGATEPQPIGSTDPDQVEEDWLQERILRSLTGFGTPAVHPDEVMESELTL